MNGCRFLLLDEVLERTGLSRTMLYELIAEGKFPRPVKLGLRRNAWVDLEVDGWMADRIAERDEASALSV